jgi:hypothetical protein
MGVAEVEGFEGVGRGVIDLLRLWKSVEKWKPASWPRQTQGDAVHERVSADQRRSAWPCKNRDDGALSIHCDSYRFK